MKGQICEESKDEQDDYEPFEGELNDLEANEEIYSLAVNEKTGVYAKGDKRNKVYFNDTLQNKLLRKFEEFKESVTSIQYSADLTCFFDAGMDS